MDSIFGWLATAGTFIYKIPQIYKLCKTKKSNDVSTISLIMQTTGYVFYIIHGFIIEDDPIIVTHMLALAQSTILIILCRIYKKKDMGAAEVEGGVGKDLICDVSEKTIESGPYDAVELVVL